MFPAQNRYFREAEGLRNMHAKIALETGHDPWADILSLLRGLFPDCDVRMAQEIDGRQYHAGIYRSINQSTPIHCDWSPFDSKTEDWIINQIERQVVFNLYLSPIVEGETIIYEQQWEEETLRLRDPATYGYFREAVEGKSSAMVRPGVGELVFFNTRNLHEVKATGWEMHPQFGRWRRPRLTLSSFIGLLPAGVFSERPSLILWS